MFKSKRASTLVMALFMLAFVVIVGTSVVLLAATSSNQTVETIAQQQSNFTAKSVLDSIVAKIQTGEINPGDIESKGLEKLTGSGTDDALGTYNVVIEPHDSIDSKPTYKVTVTAQYKDSTSEIYCIICKYSQSVKCPQFDVIALSTGFASSDNSINNACIDSDIRLDNHGETLNLAASGYVNGNIDIIGGLDLNGSFIGGSGETLKTINATEDIKIYGSASVYANVNSNKNISIGGSGTVAGDVKADGDILINGSGHVKGNIYASGKVTLSGSAVVDGNIYAKGDVTLSSSPQVKGSVYSEGNIISMQSTVNGGLYSNKSVLLTGNANKVYANGDIDLSQCTSVTELKSNASIYISNSTISSNVFARVDIVVGKNKSGSTSGATVTGNLNALGKISAYQSTINGNLQSAGNILLDSYSYIAGTTHTLGNVSVTNGAKFVGDVFAAGKFTMTSNSQGNVLVGGNAEITYALLTGNLSVKGNALLINYKNNKNVSGTVYLGGTLDPASKSYGNNIVYVSPSSIATVGPVDDVPAVTPVGSDNTVQALNLNIEIKAPIWSLPAINLQQVKQTTITVNLKATSSSSYTISGNEHIINKNCTLIIDPKSFSWDKKIVFDATNQDLYILLKAFGNDDTVDIKSGVDILSKGDHNVFLYLDDGAGNYVNLNVGSNSFVGYYNYLNGVPNPDSRKPNLFIICNAKGSGGVTPLISFNAYNSLYAYIYAPYSTVDLGGSAMLDKKLYGAVVASNMYMGGRMDYSHYIPDLSQYVIEDPDNPDSNQQWKINGTYLN
ncbi:MAG: hypothetical protein GYA50_04095 [Eubacteriaceae bacterium]|nr:hypothetical protein [Eubacteriaceae bacterium]